MTNPKARLEKDYNYLPGFTARLSDSEAAKLCALHLFLGQAHDAAFNVRVLHNGYDPANLTDDEREDVACELDTWLKWSEGDEELEDHTVTHHLMHWQILYDQIKVIHGDYFQSLTDELARECVPPANVREGLLGRPYDYQPAFVALLSDEDAAKIWEVQTLGYRAAQIAWEEFAKRKGVDLSALTEETEANFIVKSDLLYEYEHFRSHPGDVILFYDKLAIEMRDKKLELLNKYPVPPEGMFCHDREEAA